MAFKKPKSCPPEVLRERLSSTDKGQELSELIRQVKLLYLFEKDKVSGGSQIKQAQEYRESAFHCLDWLPAILETQTREIFANVFLQIGMQFQQAAAFEPKRVLQMADEGLALKMYLTAVGIASHCQPDFEMYLNTRVIKCLSAFTYQEETLNNILPTLKERTLSRVDIFPFFDGSKSNVAFLKEDHKLLGLMRRLLNGLMRIYEYNKSHSPAIPLDYSPTNLLYEAYEACLKNWYQEEYNPTVENQFRLDLMDELLFEKGWTFLEVEERLTPPWVRVDRNEEGWITPIDSLPYSSEEHAELYRSIEGAAIYAGDIYFYLTPWSQKNYGYEKLFTLSDLQQMLERNLGGAMFSLDPVDANKPYHPFNQMRFAPQRLLDSELLNTMLLTDYLLKFLTTGQEVQGYYPFDQRPVASMIKHLPHYLQIIIEKFQAAPHSGALHRFWIEAEALDVFFDAKTTKDGVTRIGLSELKMVVKKHRMTRGADGELKDVRDEEEGWPIYVLTAEQLQELQCGKRRIEGHAMVFLQGVAQLIYWENHSPLKTYYPTRDFRDNLARLYIRPRNLHGKVIVTTENMPLIYRVTKIMAKRSGMSHRYSPEFIFTHRFTTHYEEFAQYLPEFGRLRELSKIAVLIRFLNGVRQSNEDSLKTLNTLLSSQDKCATTLTAYPVFKKEQERVCQNINEAFYSLQREASSSALRTKRSTQLSELKASLGELRFNSHSAEVNKACEDWHEKLISENPDISSSKIWKEAVEPKRAEIARKMTESKQKQVADQLYSLFSPSLPSVKPEACKKLMATFIQGNSAPLAQALAEEDGKKAQAELSKQFPSTPIKDIKAALEQGDKTAIKRIGEQEFFRQLQEQQKEGLKLTASFEAIHLAKEEEQKEEDLTEACLWVPASVRHEVPKDNSPGKNRHSFFVYGG